ncbi:hypothetical protein GCM10017620_16550 [Brevundimonas intermedia]|uniref:FlgO domain-containing protein n=1 Tax=Brevundimonas intermedia TaxID=74315 RepID=A0ABQ5T7C8_9CAUL|nr:DUF6655 family protein [Brevundimonas intermedia]GLK48682.1 hypothetical protein GCM10017620_16550 [Brevundimonas intermedia]
MALPGSIRLSCLLGLIAAALSVCGCASTTESNIGRTATEQLLLARAADRAVEGLSLPLPTAASIFVDETYFQSDNSRYAISAIRGALSDAGYRLTRNRDDADAVFEIRTGALSLEQMRRVFGIPEMRIPINETFNVVSVPELSIYSNRDRVGVAEFSGFLYETKTGAPLGAVLPMIGQYRIRSHKLMMIVTWGQQQAQPGQRNPGSSWTEF